MNPDTAQKIELDIESYYQSWFHISDIYSQWAQKQGVQVNTLFLLYEVEHNRECTQASIVKNLCLPKQTVSFLLGAMERKGWIFREANPKDRRNKIIRLTEAGKEFALKRLRKLEEREFSAYSGLSGEQRQLITQGLKALEEALEKSFEEE